MYCNFVGYFCNGFDKKKFEWINEVGLLVVLCDSRFLCRFLCSELFFLWMYDMYDKFFLVSYFLVII